MFNLNLLDIGILSGITLAIVNVIKKNTGNALGDWYMLISAGIGAGLYAIALYAPSIVISFLAVGLVASAVFDVRKNS